MVKLREFSKFTYQARTLESPRKSDPFFVMYNFRRAQRAKALKKLKKEKLKQENRLFLAQKQVEKEENLRNWNHSMLQEDLVWDYACQVVKKQAKQQDSTITRSSQFEQKVQKVRLHIIYNFSVGEKKNLFQDKFTEFGEEWFQNEKSQVCQE